MHSLAANAGDGMLADRAGTQLSLLTLAHLFTSTPAQRSYDGGRKDHRDSVFLHEEL